MPALNDLLADDSSSGRHLLVLTEASGEILWRSAARTSSGGRTAWSSPKGRDWSEAGIGTNAISEALVTNRPVQLFSAEHLVRTQHEWACTAAPITGPATGRLLGVLDVSGPLDTISADTLRMVRCTIRVAEALLGNARRRDILECLTCPVLLPAGRPRDGGGRRAAETSWGQACRDVPRRRPGAADAPAGGDPCVAEFTRPRLDRGGAGLELCGDAGTTAAIRSEMFRVLSMLGDAVESNPYRFVAGLTGRSDPGPVLQLLHEGLVAEALEIYLAPLLSRSGSLAVRLLRDQLDLALGSAVRVERRQRRQRPDYPVLSTDMGAADCEAVEALGRLVGRGDARYLSFRASCGG